MLGFDDWLYFAARHAAEFNEVLCLCCEFISCSPSTICPQAVRIITTIPVLICSEKLTFLTLILCVCHMGLCKINIRWWIGSCSLMNHNVIGTALRLSSKHNPGIIHRCYNSVRKLVGPHAIGILTSCKKIMYNNISCFELEDRNHTIWLFVDYAGMCTAAYQVWELPLFLFQGLKSDVTKTISHTFNNTKLHPVHVGTATALYLINCFACFNINNCIIEILELGEKLLLTIWCTRLTKSCSHLHKKSHLYIVRINS